LTISPALSFNQSLSIYGRFALAFKS
jgi:hypothetical protein